MDRLTKLAFKYGTDKCPQIKHSYTPWYCKKFNSTKKKVKKVLEIGIGDERYPIKHYHEKSASLKMWRDFFPNAEIYGIDISRRGFVEEDRINCIYGDATDEKVLKKIIKKIGNDIDIIIDDGSHKWTDQVKSANLIKPMMSKKHTYVIEDVLEPRWVEKHLNYKSEVVSFNKRRDDRLVVVLDSTKEV